jgi:tripartite-type tricarboxylate transporter receptor subunit TctC
MSLFINAQLLKAGFSGLALAACAVSAAHAAKPAGLPGDYPARPVRVIVGSAAGGGADALARLISGKMSEAWGAQFFVDNIATSVGGILALQTTYKSPPDGYTIQNTSGSTFQNATFQHKMDFDVRKVFAPVVQITISPQYMTLSPKAPFSTLKELIAYAKANPGVVSYGSSGVGSGAHLLGEYLSDLAGIKMTHIPYRGAGQSMVDAIAGRSRLYSPARPQPRRM